MFAFISSGAPAFLFARAARLDWFGLASTRRITRLSELEELEVRYSAFPYFVTVLVTVTREQESQKPCDLDFCQPE